MEDFLPLGRLLLNMNIPHKNGRILKENAEKSQAATCAHARLVQGECSAVKENYTDNQLHVMLCWPVAASQDAERRCTLNWSGIDF